MYELVDKPIYGPVRKKLESIIHNVQKIMKKRFGFSFQYQLIGSGGRHLITRIVNGNTGFDFDYNLIIPPPKEGYRYKADVIKNQFMIAFKEALKGTEYRNPQDRTSVITIKVVDKKNSLILHSCDFATIYYDKERIENGYLYLKHFKGDDRYDFEFRKSSFNIEAKLEHIRHYNGWNWVRDNYLKLKNENCDENKSSNSLYLEAVNNVYNSILQYEDENE